MASLTVSVNRPQRPEKDAARQTEATARTLYVPTRLLFPLVPHGAGAARPGRGSWADAGHWRALGPASGGTAWRAVRGTGSSVRPGSPGRLRGELASAKATSGAECPGRHVPPSLWAAHLGFQDEGFACLPGLCSPGDGAAAEVRGRRPGRLRARFGLSPRSSWRAEPRLSWERPAPRCPLQTRGGALCHFCLPFVLPRCPGCLLRSRREDRVPGLPGEQLWRMDRHPPGLCWVPMSPLEETLTSTSPLQPVPKTHVWVRGESGSLFPGRGHLHSHCLDVDNLAKVMTRLFPAWRLAWCGLTVASPGRGCSWYSV